MQNRDTIINLFKSKNTGLSEKEIEFWCLYCVEKNKFPEIRVKLETEDISAFYEKLDQLGIIDYYQSLRNRFNEDRQKGFDNFSNFIAWYLDRDFKCCYCGVKETDLIKYFNDELFLKYNIGRQRGRCLEIEVVKNYNNYSPDNCELACYICNNAKSDFLSAKSFKPIAEGISKFWNGILNNDNTKALDTFDNNSPIWQKD